MKLRGLLIEGFRGALPEFGVDFAGKSFCLLGPNGWGKSTIVDALELWSTGDISAYHRYEARLDAAIHLDAAEATIGCHVSGYPALVRTLNGAKASKLVPGGPLPVGAELPPPIPILRHRAMADFMNQTAGDKRKALLDLLGLDRVETLRSVATRAANNAGRARAGIEQRLEEEEAGLLALTGGADATTFINDLGSRVGLTFADSDALAAATLPTAQSTGERPPVAPLVADIARRVKAVPAIDTSAWNEAVRDQHLREAAALRDLLAAAQRVLPTWESESCPLCRSSADTARLQEDVGARVAELAEATRRVDDAKTGLSQAAAALDDVVDALRRAEAVTELADESNAVSTLADRIAEEVAQIKTAVRELVPLESDSAVADLPSRVDGLVASAAKADDSAEPARALVRLAAVQESVRRVGRLRLELAQMETVASKAHDVVDVIQSAIQDLVLAETSRVGSLVADYYGRLMPGVVYSDVRLVTTDAYAGGFEFQLTYDGRHAVSPPQRVVSESQLNALGLAFFLARLKLDTQPWRALVLDDVVNSFDAPHRTTLVRLLLDEFDDWQILFFTHDHVVFDIASRAAAGADWVFRRIDAWTPAGGPVIVDGSPRARLRQQLDAGKSPDELGGLARLALEQGLSRPLGKLELRIRYDPQGRYSVFDYLVALRDGLGAAAGFEAAIEILRRMEIGGYLTNLVAHDQPNMDGISSGDLYQLATDLDALDEALKCSSCGKYVWTTSVGTHHYACGCAANLAV